MSTWSSRDAYGEFLGRLDTLEADGVTPDGLGGYWENVFRTETANAYSKQQELIEEDTDVAAALWGWEGFNPSDDRSRPSHAAIDGVKFRKGSEAAAALGRPPFGFQCRCVLVRLIGGNGAYEEDGREGSVAAGVRGW